MYNTFQLRQLSLALLLLVVCWIVPQPRTDARAMRAGERVAAELLLHADGTQLVEETKQVVADLLNISPSQVTASYCWQLIDGRFKYAASAGEASGFVYWRVVGGQIIEETLKASKLHCRSDSTSAIAM